jgi:hypothetical protein
MMVLQQAMRWGMDPYAVANKAYFVNDMVAYEAQLVNAVVNTSGEIIGRLKIEFEGDTNGGEKKETLICRVRGRLVADPDEERILVQEFKRVETRKSPLWKVNPQQQLGYFTTRAWARLYCPEVLLGVYTPDEVEEGAVAKLEADTKPRDASPIPDRRTFHAKEAVEEVEDAEVEEIESQEPENASDAEETVSSDNGAAPDQDGGVADNQEQGAESADVRPDADGAGGPGPDLVVHNNEPPVPDTPLAWASWYEERLDELEKLTALEGPDGFNAWRQRVQPTLDKADNEIRDGMQDAMSDVVVALTPKREA